MSEAELEATETAGASDPVEPAQSAESAPTDSAAEQKTEEVPEGTEAPDISITVPSPPSEPVEPDEIKSNEEQTSQSPEAPVSAPSEENSKVEVEVSNNESSEQIEPRPTLTEIREEAESPGTGESKAAQSSESLEQDTVTSVLNLCEEEIPEIPEIRPGTPEGADESADADAAGEELEGDEMAELLEELKAMKEEEEKLSSENSQLQHKLVEHFRSRRADERLGTAGDAERERGVTDYEQRYDKYLSVLQERQGESEKIKEYSDLQLETACETERERAAELAAALEEDNVFKHDSMLAAIDSRTGRQMSAELVEKILCEEAKKESEVGSIRLENIKLSRTLGKKEEQLRQKEEVAEGLHMIEFEQLKIEHQKNNERVEDRNEEINRLRGKITRTVQVLTHVKEKLHFVSNENAQQRDQLAESDVQVSVTRDRLTYIKQNRDRLRGENQKHQESGGLVNHKKLLRDLEDKNDLADHLEAHLEQLRTRHAELGELSTGIKQKITQAKVSGSFTILQAPH